MFSQLSHARSQSLMATGIDFDESHCLIHCSHTSVSLVDIRVCLDPLSTSVFSCNRHVSYTICRVLVSHSSSLRSMHCYGRLLCYPVGFHLGGVGKELTTACVLASTAAARTHNLPLKSLQVPLYPLPERHLSK